MFPNMNKMNEPPSGLFRLWHGTTAKVLGAVQLVLGILIFLVSIAGSLLANFPALLFTSCITTTTTTTIWDSSSLLSTWIGTTAFTGTYQTLLFPLYQGRLLWPGLLYSASGIFGLQSGRGELCSAVIFIGLSTVSATVGVFAAMPPHIDSLYYEAQISSSLTTLMAAITDTTSTTYVLYSCIQSGVNAGLALDIVLVILHFIMFIIAVASALLGCCRNTEQVGPRGPPGYGGGYGYSSGGVDNQRFY